MSTLVAISMTRREFAVQMTVLGGAAVVFTAIPFSSSALADVALKWGQVPPLDMGRDEALENYPGYAESIPGGRAHLFAEHPQTPVYGQLFV